MQPPAVTDGTAPQQQPSGTAPLPDITVSLVVKQLQSQMETMRHRQEQEATRAAKLKFERKSMEKQGGQQQTQIADLEIEKHKEEFMKADNERMQKYLKDMPTVAEDEVLKPLRDEIEEVNSKHTQIAGRLEADILQLQNAISIATAEKATLEKSKSQNSYDMMNVNKRYRKAESNINVYKEKIDPMQETYLKLLKENQGIEQQIADLKSSINKATTQSATLENKVQKLQKHLKEAVTNSSEMAQTKVALNDKLMSLSSELLRTNGEREKYVEGTNELQTDNKKYRLMVQASQAEIKINTEALRKIMPNITSLSGENARLEMSVADMDSRIQNKMKVKMHGNPIVTEAVERVTKEVKGIMSSTEEKLSHEIDTILNLQMPEGTGAALRSQKFK